MWIQLFSCFLLVAKELCIPVVGSLHHIRNDIDALVTFELKEIIHQMYFYGILIKHQAPILSTANDV